jgi:HAD superfamily hydrolase (TIGR01549 family)
LIKAVFFDFYHTLVSYDPPREEIGASVLRDFGIEIKPEELSRPLTIADEYFIVENARSPMSKSTSEERLAAFTRYQEVMLKEAGIEPSSELIAAIIEKWRNSSFKLVLFDDVVPVLAGLKQRGLVLGLISNVDTDIMPNLTGLGLAPLLDVVATSLDTGYTKPQPQIFQEAVARAGVKAGEALFIGDQYQIDVLGAEKAGLKGLLLDRGGHFKGVGDCPYIRNLNQVAEYLSR